MIKWTRDGRSTETEKIHLISKQLNSIPSNFSLISEDYPLFKSMHQGGSNSTRQPNCKIQFQNSNFIWRSEIVKSLLVLTFKRFNDTLISMQSGVKNKHYLVIVRFGTFMQNVALNSVKRKLDSLGVWSNLNHICNSYGKLSQDVGEDRFVLTLLEKGSNYYFKP